MKTFTSNVTNNPTIWTMGIPFVAAFSTPRYIFIIHIINWFWFFSTSFFCCVFFPLEEQGIFSSFSSLDSEAFNTRLPRIAFFPPLVCFLFLSPVMPQLVFRTSKTDWLKENSLTSSVAFALGSCFKISCQSNGNIPHALNPETRFWDFKRFINLPKSDGKTVFGRLSAHLDSLRHVSNISCHSIFAGLNTATSNGWHVCWVWW